MTGAAGVLRALLVAGGLGLLGFGGWKLLDSAGDATAVAVIAVWLLGGVLIHDFVVAPLGLAIAAAGKRWLPSTWQREAVIVLVVVGSMTLWSLPVLSRFGARPDNPTLLDRNYVAGWAAVCGLTLFLLLTRRLVDGVRARRR
ncbi:MAG: hypothetical protein V9F00_16135 [Nocardioides sp.]